MQKTPVLDFFLGALAPSGFRGWFRAAADEPHQTPWLIKAGPGCGKSTLMRRLLAAAPPAPAGGWNERLHCSSDPGSLDGVRLPGARALFLDATAPHTLDSKYPGAAERVLSLYDTLDAASLAAHRAGILALGARHAALMQQAAAHWALACALLQRRRALDAAALDADRLQRFTARLAARTMPRRRGAAPGLQRHRLLSAPTPGKLTVFTATAPALAPAALYALHDPCGAAAARMLAQLAEHARENGYEAILCHCPTDQGGKLDHLFIPERGLGFVTANRWHPMQCPGQKNIHTARFRRPGAPDSCAPAAWYRRTAGALVQKTCDAQTAAKAVHDELERYYVHATDFAAVDALRGRVERELFA